MKLLENRKGHGFPFMDEWAELFTIALFIITLILALFIPSAAFAYLIGIMIGYGSARYLINREWRFPYAMVTLAVLLAYLIGARYGSRKTMLVLYLIGFALSHYLHKQQKVK